MMNDRSTIGTTELIDQADRLDEPVGAVFLVDGSILWGNWLGLDRELFIFNFHAKEQESHDMTQGSFFASVN